MFSSWRQIAVAALAKEPESFHAGCRTRRTSFVSVSPAGGLTGSGGRPPRSIARGRELELEHRLVFFQVPRQARRRAAVARLQRHAVAKDAVIAGAIQPIAEVR